MLDYKCEDGEWSYAEMTPQTLFATNPDGTKSQITQEEVTVSKKTLGIHDAPVEGNETKSLNLDRQNDKRAPSSPHSMDSLKASALAGPQVRARNNDK